MSQVLHRKPKAENPADTLNALLERAEALLRERWEGTTACVSVPASPESAPTKGAYDGRLWFARRGTAKVWGLYWEPQHGETVPLLNATLEARTRCAGLLNALHLALEREHVRMGERLAIAIVNARTFVGAYETGHRDSP